MPAPPLLLFVLRGGLERTETFGPEHLERCPELGEGLWPRAVEALRAIAALGHETGLFQYT
jgi:hypothetical protein